MEFEQAILNEIREEIARLNDLQMSNTQWSKYMRLQKLVCIMKKNNGKLK